MRLLAIDPGNVESGWCLIDTSNRIPLQFGKSPNEKMLDHCFWLAYDESVIEMVSSYGMPVGAEVFDTCVWIGRFYEVIRAGRVGGGPSLVKRQPVKLHHCHSPRATDATVRQALVDRFTPGQPNHGKGTKRQPGWFYGFSADIWQAYALAVYAADQLDEQVA